MKNKIKDFQWDHVEDTGRDDVYLMDTDDDSIVILISRDEVFDHTKPVYKMTGMSRSGWDDYRETHTMFSPEDRWGEEASDMVADVWDKITRTYLDADEEIIKTIKPIS
jgi:hypothetical protein